MSWNGEEEVIRLKKFDPQTMEERRVDPNQGPPSIMLIGAKRTGKTYLIRDLMYYFRKIPSGIIFTGSEGSRKVFSEFFPKICIFEDLGKKELKRIQDIVKNNKSLIKLHPKKDHSTFLLFDDCGYDKSFAKHKIIRGLFMNGRHWKTLTLMAVQDTRAVLPDIRKNVDYVFILRETRQTEREKLWKDYAGIIPDYKQFCAIMNKCTENYGALVIDNTKLTNNFRDSVFFYKAKKTAPKFKIGSKRIWKIQEEMYQSDSEDDDSNFYGKTKVVFEAPGSMKKPTRKLKKR